MTTRGGKPGKRKRLKRQLTKAGEGKCASCGEPLPTARIRPGPPRGDRWLHSGERVMCRSCDAKRHGSQGSTSRPRVPDLWNPLVDSSHPPHDSFMDESAYIRVRKGLASQCRAAKCAIGRRVLTPKLSFHARGVPSPAQLLDREAHRAPRGALRVE